jgi:hypothetical protein
MFSLTELFVISYLSALVGLVVGLLLGKASAQQEQDYRAARIAAAVEQYDRDMEDPESIPRPPSDMNSVVMDLRRRPLWRSRQ